MQGWGAWPSCSAQLNLNASQTQTPVVTPQVVETTPVAVEAVVEQAPAAPLPVSPVVEEPSPLVESVAPTANVAAPAVAATGSTYTVKAGDTLSAIALQHGYTGWEQLWAANSATIPNPNVIEIGDVLILPGQ